MREGTETAPKGKENKCDKRRMVNEKVSKVEVLLVINMTWNSVFFIVCFFRI